MEQANPPDTSHSDLVCCRQKLITLKDMRVDSGVLSRAELHQRLRFGYLLELFTLGWNFFEGIVAVTAAWISSSVALMGFGIDSFIETSSAALLAWHLRKQMLVESLAGAAFLAQYEAAERRVARWAGLLLIVLAIYIAIDATNRLLGHGRHPEESLVGIVLTAISLVVMPLLARLKLKVAADLQSSALRADAFETIACAWLSLTTLAGLLANAIFGWWWADAVAGLVLIPLLIKEGLEAIRGERCGCSD